MLETAYGGLKQRECDFRKNERDESEAIIRATGKKKTRKKFQALSISIKGAGLIIHATHTTHAAARHSWSPIVPLRPFGDHGFCGDE